MLFGTKGGFCMLLLRQRLAFCVVALHFFPGNHIPAGGPDQMGGVCQRTGGQGSFGVSAKQLPGLGEHRAVHSRQSAGLKVQSLGVCQLRQKGVHPLVLQSVAAAHKGAHQPAHKAGSAPHGKTIGGGAVVDAKVLHTNAVVFAGGHAQHHAGGVGGLGEEAVCGIAEQHLQAKGHAAGAAAHTAGQIGEEGMLRIHGDALRVQLLF